MHLELNLRSSELNKNTGVNIIIPNKFKEDGESYKTVWLLHGLKGDHTSWMRSTSIERYASAYNVAVVMPEVDRSWYTNTAYGINYFNYVSEELPSLCRKLFNGMSDKREDNIVAGLSMGGYGALKLALTYPERYCSCISLSGALDITRKGRPCNLNEWRSIFNFNMESPLELEGTKHDIFALASNNKAEGRPFPNIYMWCGLEDPLLLTNQNFDRLLSELGVEHRFDTSEGDHSWNWWDLHIQDGLRYIFDK